MMEGTHLHTSHEARSYTVTVLNSFSFPNGLYNWLQNHIMVLVTLQADSDGLLCLTLLQTSATVRKKDGNLSLVQLVLNMQASM